jgi:hypothetical protein
MVLVTFARTCDRILGSLSYSFEIRQVTGLADRDESSVLRVSVLVKRRVVRAGKRGLPS